MKPHFKPPAKPFERKTFKNLRTVAGRGRGKHMGIPTVNVDFSGIPAEFEHGIYACFMEAEGKRYDGAMHYGPRPVFQDTVAMEVHALDETLPHQPETVTITVVGRIRDVMDFPDAAALVARIGDDVKIARAMLKSA